MINIRNFVAKTLAITFIILLFLFAFTWIIFDFQNSSDSIKDTWIIVSSLFSGIATLAAAYIATQLFNDWREQHNKQIENKFILDVIYSFEVFDSEAASLSVMFHSYEAKYITKARHDRTLEPNNESLNLVFDKFSELVVPLSKLLSYYEYHLMVNNFPKDDKFKNIIDDILKHIFNASYLDDCFTERYDYLKRILLPKIQSSIELLEKDYINNLRSNLKTKQ